MESGNEGDELLPSPIKEIMSLVAKLFISNNKYTINALSLGDSLAHREDRNGHHCTSIWGLRRPLIVTLAVIVHLAVLDRGQTLSQQECLDVCPARGAIVLRLVQGEVTCCTTIAIGVAVCPKVRCGDVRAGAMTVSARARGSRLSPPQN
eukprot:CAMPEP_0171081818 /NCGR_PEP_ID=MMETSP0766_2-20121228/16739_1 /TAXON_ID=439317 /ORGANISM="Gambierdiscus australes, Strain CAWD 149" /LENGTH=149 /DNA_ID=CAMNT_0011539149 /DNA_START=214 /DNA_END=660 /DNA_ORIENTATION=+